MLNRIILSFIVSAITLIAGCSTTTANQSSVKTGLNKGSYSAIERTIQQLPDGVSIHQLDNGLKVLLIENPALPMIGVNTIVKVGFAYETSSTSGMSHMLEHLLFNGTTRWNQRELYDFTDKIGGYNNANTSDYYTNYMMVTPAENIKDGMAIQAGMLFDSVLPEKNFQKEKGIVLEEIAKSLGNTREQVNRNVYDILYRGHALSLPKLGTYETIKGLDRDYVNEFYKNNYVPNNMLMSVIGNFDTAQMLEVINEIYGKVKPDIVKRTETSEWSMGFDRPAKRTSEMQSHRFYKGKETILQQFYPLNNHTVDFNYLLSLSLDKQKDRMKLLLDKQFPKQVKTIDFSIQANPVKSFIQANIVLNSEENISGISNTFERALRATDLSLSDDAVYAQGVKSQSTFLKQIEKPHMFGIYNADLIAQHGLGAIIEAFSSEGIIKAGKKLTNFRVTGTPQLIIQHPAKKSGKTESSEIKVALFENGKLQSTVIAKQNVASDLLAIHYLYKYKYKHESGYHKDIAKKWHSAFGNRMKSEANQKVSAKYGLGFVVNDNAFIPMDDIYLSPSFGYIRVEGLANDIEGAISYLNKEMLGFIPTEEEFNKVNKGTMQSMMMGGKDPSKKLYEDTINSMVKEPVTPLNDATDLQYEDFLKFGKNYFAPSNIVISVVSKDAPETVNNYFSSFSSDIAPSFSGLAKVQGYKLRSEPQVFAIQGGGEQSHTFYGFAKDYDIEDEAALTVLSLILRDDIIFNIREKQGLAYRMYAGINKVDGRALFYAKIPTLPHNVEKLVPQFPGLFDPAIAKKLTEDDLDKTINMYLGKMMFRRLSSINQAYYLAHSYYFDGNIASDEKQLKAVKNVKLADVKRVIKKYLKVENPVEIIIH